MLKNAPSNRHISTYYLLLVEVHMNPTKLTHAGSMYI